MKNKFELQQPGAGLTRKQFLGTVGWTLFFPWLTLLPKVSRAAGSRPPTGAKPWLLSRLDPTLWAWMQAKRKPVFESLDPVVKFLIWSVLNQQPVEFRYWGGSEPGRLRCVTPALVFHTENSETLYLAGYCHVRQQERVFRVENMELPDGHVEYVE